MIANGECAVCGTRHPAEAKFCAECGAHLAWSMAERRIITVLFADLSGFTGLTERLDAERVHSLITVWLDPLCEAVLRWGGHVDKFIGDCVMALFGAPVAYENEPERAVRAALDMQRAFDAERIVAHAAAAGIGDYRPRLTIGVNTGPVVTGVFASGGAWDYTAIGDTVNVAARLQGICEPGGILVGEATWARTRHLFEFGEEQVLQVKGRVEPVRARQVTGVLAERGEIRGFAGVKTPLVGRADDLERLLAAWRRAARGEPTACLVLGDAGIGKSRLVAELVGLDDVSAAKIARGRCYPYASSTPWEPVAELLRDLHDVGPDRSASEAVSWIVGRAGSTWSKDERAGLGAVLGSPTEELRALADLPPEERHHRMARAVARAIREGAGSPALLVLEDVHWADRTTLEFLHSLPDHELEGPALFVLVSRPPLPSEDGVAALVERFGSAAEVDRSAGEAIRVDLSPLTAEETAALVEAALGPHELPPDLLGTIHQRSGGNPLFIEEILKALIAGDVLVEESDVWRAAGDTSGIAIPDSIDSVLTTRIDGLGASTRKVLQLAAIVGRRFWSGVLDEALARRSVDEELGELIDAALVRPHPESSLAGEREYAFQHLLLQEVAYGGLLTGMRSELHGTVGAWLESRLEQGTAEHDDWVAFHFERSDEPGRALPFLERAIATARDRGALLDAEGLVDRARAVAGDHEDHLRLERLAVELAVSTGNDERRAAAIRRLGEIASALGDPAVAAEAELRRAQHELDVGDLESARGHAATAADAFRGLADESFEADALRLLGRVAHLQGAYDEALSRYREALSLERHAGDRRGEAEILQRLGQAEVDFGNFPRALEQFDQALGIYAELGHRPGQARALADRATAFRWLGRYEEAEETARRAEELARACGSRTAAATAALARATAIGAAGRTDEARTILEGILATPGLHRPALEAHTWLALASLEAGERAGKAVERARWVAARSGLVDVEVLGLSRLAEIALEAGRPEAAEPDSRRAVELLEKYGDIQGPDEVVYYVHSRVLAALGRAADAAAMRDRARRIVRETAAAIDDEAWRRSFLENVAPNPDILADVE